MKKILRKIRELLARRFYLFYLSEKVSGNIWEKASGSFREYNKMVVALSSSALVLSFSAVNIFKSNLDTKLLGISWIFLALSILFGILMLFAEFVYNLTEAAVERLDTKNKEHLLSREVVAYFNMRLYMFFLAFLELAVFIAGLCCLVLSAKPAL